MPSTTLSISSRRTYNILHADTAEKNAISKQELIALLKKESSLLDLDEEKEHELTKRLEDLQGTVLEKYPHASSLASLEVWSEDREKVSAEKVRYRLVARLMLHTCTA